MQTEASNKSMSKSEEKRTKVSRKARLKPFYVPSGNKGNGETVHAASMEEAIAKVTPKE